MRTLLLAAATVVAATLTLAGPASGASLVFVKEGNVWSSAPDGSGAHALTTDGSRRGSEYWSPSQADDGTIAAARQGKILLLRPNGTLIREVATVGLADSGGQKEAGAVQWVALSPDGSKIAWAQTGVGCTPSDSWCRINGLVGVMTATGEPIAAGPSAHLGGDPSWIGNHRVLVHRAYNYLWDPATGASEIWFNDYDVNPVLLGTEDVLDGELSADGRRFAAVRGSDESRNLTVQVYDVVGDVAGEPKPAPPVPLCASPVGRDLADPTLSADGGEVYWGQFEGLYAWSLADGCAAAPRQIVPAATQPDWGPADPVPAAVTPVKGDDQPPVKGHGTKKGKKKKKGKKGKGRRGG